MRQLAILLFSMLVAASAVAADPLDDAIALFKRQNVNLSTGGSASDTATPTATSTGDDDNDTSSSSSPSSSPSPSPSSSPTSPPPVVTSSVVTLPPSSSSLEVITSTSTFTPTSSSSPSSAEESSGSSPSRTTVDTETVTPSRTLITTSSIQEVVTTITSISAGSTLHITSTSSSVIPVTTSVDPASLTDGDGHHGSSGLSDTDKKIIGGVVGGVGGALLLAGLAYTAWRIWGKKKNLHNDDLYDPNLNQDKLSATTGSDSTPFRSTLDQYHSPGPVNTASNF